MSYRVLLLLLIAICGCSGNKGNITGEASREFADYQRSNWTGTGNRIIRTIIWYPGSENGTIVVDTVYPDKTIHFNCDINKGSPTYPLIILSPGSGSHARQMSWLGYKLSANGYITVAVEHSGTNEEERSFGPPTLSDFCLWEHPADVKVVLDGILKDQMFSKRIDKQRIGIAGFSLGGTTAIWTTGAVLDLKILAEKSPPPPPFLAKNIELEAELLKTDSILKKSYARAENYYTEPRIKAAFALAPALGYGFTEESLKKIGVPVKIVVGDKDIVAPAETSSDYYAKYIPNSSLTILPGERGHYTKPVSTAQMRKELEEVASIALSFFNAELQ